MKTAYLASSLCLITSIAGNAWGQELIVNGGFDYGFFGWSPSNIDPAGGWRSAGGNPDGTFILNDVGGYSTDPTIFQEVSMLIPKMHYQLTGAFKRDYVGGCITCPSFAVDFNGSTVFTEPAYGSVDWRNFSVEVVATGTSAGLRLRGEINGTDTDWLVDNISLVPFTPCLGDITGNLIVDSVDLAIVLSAWGSSGGEFAGTDINQDGIVNATDLTAILSSWGPCQ